MNIRDQESVHGTGAGSSPVRIIPEDTDMADECKGGHEWVVFSTALRDVCLMVQCPVCGEMGTVDDPTQEEWAEAFHAPSRPYRWEDDSRVNVRGCGPLYVRKAGKERGHSDPASGGEVL